MLRASSMAALAALSTLMMPSAAFAAFETRVETIDLPVSMQSLDAERHKYPTNKVYWTCPFDSRGTGPDPASPGMVKVGWYDLLDEGSGPMPCMYRQNHVARALLTFSLDPLRERAKAGVGGMAFARNALLSFRRKHVSGNRDCDDRLMLVIPGGATIPPNVEEVWDMPVPKLGSAGCVGDRCTVDIKNQFNDWMTRKTPEMGLVIKGDREDLDANDNASCVTEYGDARLNVTFAYDVPKGLVKPVLIKPGLIFPITRLDVAFVRKTASDLIYELTWEVISATGRMDIVRDGAVVATVADSGRARDRAPFGPHSYKVCIAGTTSCSDEVKVSN